MALVLKSLPKWNDPNLTHIFPTGSIHQLVNLNEYNVNHVSSSLDFYKRTHGLWPFGEGLEIFGPQELQSQSAKTAAPPRSFPRSAGRECPPAAWADANKRDGIGMQESLGNRRCFRIIVENIVKTCPDQWFFSGFSNSWEFPMFYHQPISWFGWEVSCLCRGAIEHAEIEVGLEVRKGVKDGIRICITLDMSSRKEGGRISYSNWCVWLEMWQMRTC